ncbi:MAG TPA: hypothetical protein VL178_15705 [Pseudomonas sp.]|nr:hypothetical protein [Pseudomonas sp.]
MTIQVVDVSAVHEKLPSEIQQDLILFEDKKAAYLKLQEEIAEAREGEHTPLRQAEALERQAHAAELALENAARFRNIEQDEISAELMRIEKMKQEGKELRFTAKCREGKAEPLSLQLAALRLPLEGLQRRINNAANKELLRQVLNQPGMRDALLQAFSLSRAITFETFESCPELLAHCIDNQHREREIKKRVNSDFTDMLLRLFGGVETETFPPQLATLPARAAGEKPMSPAQLHKARTAKLG